MPWNRLHKFASDDWEMRIEELWIEREVLKNMLTLAGTASELTVSCALSEAKADKTLGRLAREYFIRHFHPTGHEGDGDQ
jgi:hypothetical protein